MWKGQFKLSSNYLAFFHLVCNLLELLFSHILLVSKLYELSFWFQRCHLRPFSIAIYGKFDLYYLCLFRLFFWSANSRILVFKLCLLFQTVLDLWLLLILEIFSSWDFKEGHFQFLVTFLTVFLWSVNCTNQVCILSHILNKTIFEHGKCFIWVFSGSLFIPFKANVSFLTFSGVAKMEYYRKMD